jgi:hypothetical protein
MPVLVSPVLIVASVVPVSVVVVLVSGVSVVAGDVEVTVVVFVGSESDGSAVVPVPVTVAGVSPVGSCEVDDVGVDATVVSTSLGPIEVFTVPPVVTAVSIGASSPHAATGRVNRRNNERWTVEAMTPPYQAAATARVPATETGRTAQTRASLAEHPHQ